MKTTLRLEGLKELDGALEALIAATSSRTAKTALRKALIDAGEPMAARARQLAPARSGKLRASIAISATLKNPAGKAAYAAAKRAGASSVGALSALRDAQRAAKGEAATVEVYVGMINWWASKGHWIEFGTKPHVIRPKKSKGGKFLSIWTGSPASITARVAEVQHPGQPPRPFLRPAFNQTAPIVLASLADKVRVRLAEAAARSAKRKASAAARAFR